MEEECINSILDAVIEELQLRKSSPKTIKAYAYYIHLQDDWNKKSFR